MGRLTVVCGATSLPRDWIIFTAYKAKIRQPELSFKLLRGKISSHRQQFYALLKLQYLVSSSVKAEISLRLHGKLIKQPCRRWTWWIVFLINENTFLLTSPKETGLKSQPGLKFAMQSGTADSQPKQYTFVQYVGHIEVFFMNSLFPLPPAFLFS